MSIKYLILCLAHDALLTVIGYLIKIEQTSTLIFSNHISQKSFLPPQNYNRPESAFNNY